MADPLSKEREAQIRARHAERKPFVYATLGSHDIDDLLAGLDRLRAERDAMRDRAWAAEGALTTRLALRREVEEALGMVPGLSDADALSRGVEKIRELRALPVLRTCADCGYCVTDLHVGEWCDRDEQQRDTERESPPPSWCPLRGAR